MNIMTSLDSWNFLDELLNPANRAFRSIRAHATGRFPPINVFADDTAILLELELPGKSADDVDLSLEPQAVIIAARNPENATDGKSAAGQAAPAWSRRLELPFRINAGKANAKFTNGILRVELPKSEADGVRRIAIQ